jgi:Cell Wall Hydrolase
MGRSRLTWACLAVTPWFMAIGLLLSTTAEAGQDPSLTGVAVPRSPTDAALLASAAKLAGRPNDDLLHPARFTVGSPDDLNTIPDELDPNPAIKAAGAEFPAIDRSSKGDPFIPLRPGFDSRLRPPVPTALDDGEESDLSAGDAKEDSANAGSSPQAPVPGGSEASVAPTRVFDDGATPSIPLEIALNSSTPTPSDGIPLIIVARPGSEMSVAARSIAGGRPDYASLIDPKDAVRQQRCLAEAVYFESRSEPELGQAAVAQVVLNRVKSGDYPANVCGVVYQDRNRPFACQFSFACEGKSLRIEEPGPWATAVRIARDVTSGALYNAKVGDAVNYHANYVLPYWASTLKRVASIGHHIFYQVRVSQN